MYEKTSSNVCIYTKIPIKYCGLLSSNVDKTYTDSKSGVLKCFTYNVQHIIQFIALIFSCTYWYVAHICNLKVLAHIQ